MKLFETVVSVCLLALVSSLFFPFISSTAEGCERYCRESKKLSDNRYVVNSFKKLCRRSLDGKEDFPRFIEDLSRQKLVQDASVNCIGFTRDLRPVMELTWQSDGERFRALSLCGVDL